MVVPWIWVPLTKTQEIWPNAKKCIFLHFLCPSVKKFQMAANRTILVREEMPTAHLKAYVPNFPKHPWESRKSLKLRELCPSKVRWSRFVSLKNAVFSALFWRKSFFWPTSTKSTPPMIGIFGKLCISAFCTYPNIRVFLNRQAVRILLTLPDWLDYISWQCVIIERSSTVILEIGWFCTCFAPWGPFCRSQRLI